MNVILSPSNTQWMLSFVIQSQCTSMLCIAYSAFKTYFLMKHVKDWERRMMMIHKGRNAG